MKIKVIALKNLPTKVPVLSSAVIYLYMDKFNASPLIWGIVGTLWGLFLLLSIVAVCTQERVDLFKSQNKVGQGG